MIQCGQIFDYIADQIGDTSTETRAIIKRATNLVYFNLCTFRIWSALRTEATVAANILPANCSLLHYLEKDTDYVYKPIERAHRYQSQNDYNWYYDVATTAALLSGTTVTATANSATVTSSASVFTSAHVNEYIRIGTNIGYYLITAFGSSTSITISPAYRGDTTSATTYFEIRPAGTKKVLITDNAGVNVTGSFTAFYSRYPDALYNDYDAILLPGSCLALQIAVLQSNLEWQKYDVDSQRKQGAYENALAEMEALDPIGMPFVVPRNKLGRRIFYGRARD